MRQVGIGLKPFQPILLYINKLYSNKLLISGIPILQYGQVGRGTLIMRITTGNVEHL